MRDNARKSMRLRKCLRFDRQNIYHKNTINP